MSLSQEAECGQGSSVCSVYQGAGPLPWLGVGPCCASLTTAPVHSDRFLEFWIMRKGVKVFIPSPRRSLEFLMQICPPHMHTCSSSCTHLQFNCIHMHAHTHTLPCPLSHPFHGWEWRGLQDWLISWRTRIQTQICGRPDLSCSPWHWQTDKLFPSLP